MADMTETVEHKVLFDDQFDALNIQTGHVDKLEDELSSKKYPAKSHARKVAAELAKSATGLENGLIYLPGEPSRLYEDSDQGPDLRQRRYFYYITGANFEDCAVTYEIASDRLTLWIPYVEPRQILWYGATPDAAAAMQLYDVDDVRYTSDLSRFLAAQLGPSATLFVLRRSQAPQYLFANGGSSSNDRPSAANVGSGDDDFPPDRKPGAIDMVNLKPAMDRARVIKDAYEVSLIRRANDISSAAHRQICRQLLQLRNEQEIEAMFLASCTARGAHSQAYHIIAGAGVNASTLHYDANDQPLAGKQLVVVDAGCEYRLYASDVTRTLPLSGTFSPEAGAVYAIVERMQEQCIAAVGPGRRFRELHLHAARVAARGLLALGVLRGDRAEVEESGIAGAFFPHGLGHHVGLEVHDVNGDQRLMSSIGAARLEGSKREMVTPADLVEMRRLERETKAAADGSAPVKYQLLEPGMIVTVEPGIYFCREYIEGYYLAQPRYAKFIDRDVLERYYPVGGVRIEDDILVTENGYENLTTAPKGKEMLDIINREEYEFL